MIEFLTENARRAYPLSQEWPAPFGRAWNGLLLDACFGLSCRSDCLGVLLSGIRRSADGLVLTFATYGGSSAYALDITVPADMEGRSVLFGRSDSLCGFITVGKMPDALVQAVPETVTAVGVPLAVRCVRNGTSFVSSVEAYSPELCTRPVFAEEDPHPPPRIAQGYVVLAAKDGLDLEVVDSGSGVRMLRVSALSADADASAAGKDVDLMIRGDDCVTVSELPGVYVTEAGGLARAEDPSKHGVVLIGQKCKPCCQCEDYRDAVYLLKPWDKAAHDVKDILDQAALEYAAACTAFSQYKERAKADINDYGHIKVSATAVAGGGMYGASDAAGARCRVSVNVSVVNMTMETATVASLAAVFPTESQFELVRTRWSKTGAISASGAELPGSVFLEPGDALLVVFTYAQLGTSGTVVVPRGIVVRYEAQLPSRLPSGVKEVQVGC